MLNETCYVHIFRSIFISDVSEIIAPRSDSMNITLSSYTPLSVTILPPVSRRFLFSVPYPRPRAHTSITAKCDYTRRIRRASSRRKILRACVLACDGNGDLSSSPRRCCSCLSPRMQNLGADNRYGDILLLHVAKIESYIYNAAKFIAEVGLLFLPPRLMIHLGTVGP